MAWWTPTCPIPISPLKERHLRQSVILMKLVASHMECAIRKWHHELYCKLPIPMNGTQNAIRFWPGTRSQLHVKIRRVNSPQGDSQIFFNYSIWPHVSFLLNGPTSPYGKAFQWWQCVLQTYRSGLSFININIIDRKKKKKKKNTATHFRDYKYFTFIQSSTN